MNLSWFKYATPRRNNKRLEVLLEHRQSGRLLDVGCGDCEFMLQASEYFESTGIDNISSAISSSLLKSGYPIIIDDITKVDFSPESFDIVTAFNVLEHFHNPERVVSKIYQILNKGGIFFGSVPNNSLFLGKIHTALSNLGDRTHVSTLKTPHWMSLFRKAGFKEFNYFGEILIGRHSIYLKSPRWYRFVSFNLMFICWKTQG
ncbi:MAG: class I SAM-dependent methyltransferase, partial [Anaerolineales bacterium]|nr:class I SAM-dependent methyltransferase [Anaerolineales bacterium]